MEPLPPGRTCSDCIRLSACWVTLHLDGTETECHWSPSRFVEAPAARLEAVEEESV
jgi:hypothetical protein